MLQEVKQKTIRYYVLPSKISPFKEWFYSLKDSKIKSIVLTRINRVVLGNLGDCRSLGETIYELKIHYGPGLRLYFGIVENIIIILLLGGTKKSQKQDIAKAKEYWQDFKNNHLK
ncbi:MAG: type II toxin-antitoxin system RelE/ParE family toxin [bacterium]|nr:type II toxin-antitoxin system RelE/ParE family toxin [bacterium]